MKTSSQPSLVFFLGGRDLEMETIAQLLAQHAPGRWADKGLGWGAKASSYRREIEDALQRGQRPVLVELEADLDLDPQRVEIIDHHGQRAGADRPTSLHHVFDLLDLPQEAWTRRLQLVAANDRGYIPEMRRNGATDAEIVEIRNSDRRAQGISAEQDAQARQSIEDRRVLHDGFLSVVHLPHGRTASVSDFLDPAFGGPGCRNLLVVSPSEVNFFGQGRLVRLLDETYPGGWYGGALPQRGFWGWAADEGETLPDVVPTLMKEALAEDASDSGKDSAEAAP